MISNIQLIVYDFDGVLTDNRVILREDGLESVIVSRSDGLAISILKKMGVKQIILTTEENKVVEVRAHKLGLPIMKGVNDKKALILTYCHENKINLENVVYVGNDVNDLEAMKVVGYPVCPADAHCEIKSVSRETLKTKGGFGVVRELLDKIQESNDE